MPHPDADPLAVKVAQLLALPQGWDSYGAKRIAATECAAALAFLDNVQIVPTVNGGVVLEWHHGGIDLEVRFEDGKITVSAENDHD